MAGALAYVTFIPAILFLVMEPYNKDKFIRFHSFQCLFFAATMFVLSIVMMIVGFVLAFVPVLGWILDLLLWLTLSFGSLGLVIFLIYKAYNGAEIHVTRDWETCRSAGFAVTRFSAVVQVLRSAAKQAGM